MQAPPDELLRAWRPIYEQFLSRVRDGAASVPKVVASSWWRSRSRNATVGGALYSQHLLGFALDLVTPTPRALVVALVSQGLHAIDEGDHVHVQAFPPGALPRSLFESV